MWYALAIFLFFISCVSWSYRDFTKWKNGLYDQIGHIKHLPYKVLTTLPSYVMVLCREDVHFVISGLLYMSAWWLFFDGFFNLWRGFPFFKRGSNDKYDPIIENITERMSNWLIVSTKIVVFIVLIVVYIL